MDTYAIIQVVLIPLLCAVILVFAIKQINEDERGAIFRLGRFFRVVGPGIVVVVPFVDKLVIIDLNVKLPGWYSLSEKELTEKVKEIIITNK